jgi:hypothetical protein
MRGHGSRYTVDWGHLVFLAIIAVAVLWYLLDAMSVSLNIHNLLLVAPLAVLALCLCLVIAPQCFHREDLQSKDTPSLDLPSLDLPSQDLQSQDLQSQDLQSQDLQSQDLQSQDLQVQGGQGPQAAAVGEAASGEALPVAGSAALRSADKRDLLLIGGVALSLGLYVSLLNVIGFDIATCLFVLAVMLICGERRPLALIVFPLVVAVVLIAAFRALLPYPMYSVVI